MRLWIERAALDEIADLPGHMRQRMRRVISNLSNQPRPDNSRVLTITKSLQIPGIEARRLRIEQWRVIYVIDQEQEQINILAVRRRPPYSYDDLADLLGEG